MIYVILTHLFSSLLFLLTALKSKKKISRILVIQTAKIGDLICSTPVFREIKKKYPEVHLAVMANPVTKELLQFNPYVNEIIAIENAYYRGLSGKIKLSNLIRKGKYDVSVCLNPNVPFAVAMFWGLVPERLSVMPDFAGITFRIASAFHTHLERHIRGKMVIETYMKMLRAIGIESNNLFREVYKSEGADSKANEILKGIDKPLIGIAITSGNKLKELGIEKIAKLANILLNDLEVHVVLIGSAQDRDVAHEVLNSIIKKHRIIDTTGRLSLSELPALIEKLSLFIGVDTGVTYMADALSIPLIDIAGPSDMSDQRPMGKDALIIQSKIPCVQCSHSFHAPYNCKINTRECIESIDVHEIVNAAKKLLIKI